MDDMDILRYMVTIEGIVERDGWAVQGVFPTEGDRGCPFAYTVGLWQRFGHPELVMTGLDPRTCQALLNDIAGRVKDGARFSPGDRLDDVVQGHRDLVMPVTFVAMSETSRDENLGVACRYNGLEPFDALQVLWPDTNGVLPGEPGFEERFVALQPVWSRL
jgi:hypothetical protein